jgi:hypothetical protein
MHDYYIVYYCANVIEKELIIQTIQPLNDLNKHKEDIYFRGSDTFF